MATNGTAPQMNGVASASAPTSTPAPSQQPSQPAAHLSASNANITDAAEQTQPPPSPSAAAPRPRDARVIELLLTSQGVSSYESRLPLLLLDFAYRHTSAILNDAIHLAVDPYTTHAGSKPSASSGATAQAPSGSDALVTASAARLAIAARQNYQFRSPGAPGGLSKEWLLELSRERNKVALPRVPPNEWAVRLPSERFVLSGLGWGLRDVWTEIGGNDDDDDDDEEMVDGADGAMEGVEPTIKDEDAGGDGIEGGTMEDVFGGDMDEDMDAE